MTKTSTAICLLALGFAGYDTTDARAATYVYITLEGEDRIVTFGLTATGQLRPISSIPVRGGPGVLTHNQDGTMLYASMRSIGRLASYQIDQATGTLNPRGSIPAGADPAFISLDRSEQFLLTAYYVAGEVAVHRLDSDRVPVHPALCRVTTADKAHAVSTDHSNRFAYVPHTGPNRIFQFHFDPQAGQLSPLSQPFVQAEPDQEPRHIVWHPTQDVAFVSNERGSSLTVYRLNRSDGNLVPLQTLPTIPAHYRGNNTCAKLDISPNGQFVYVANRGHDSIAAFTFDASKHRLTSLGHNETEPTPRGFDIDASGRFLIAAGQGSGKVVVFRIKPQGRLQRLETYEVGLRPWWTELITMAQTPGAN